MQPKIRTKDKDVFHKLLALKISNEVIFKDNANARRILNRIKANKNTIDITSKNGFLIVRKCNPFTHSVYLKR